MTVQQVRDLRTVLQERATQEAAYWRAKGLLKLAAEAERGAKVILVQRDEDN